jgi:hypothetical protein
MSYNSGADYGCDQINIDSNDFRDFLLHNDNNVIDNITKINERETRLLKKINKFKSVDRNDIDQKFIDKYKLLRKDPHVRNYKSNQHQNTRLKYERNNTRTNNTDVFNYDGLQYLHDELKNIEKKNDMILLFMFFLVVVVVVQYLKINNNKNPTQLMILPEGGETTENTVGILRSVKITTQ